MRIAMAEGSARTREFRKINGKKWNKGKRKIRVTAYLQWRTLKKAILSLNMWAK
jgi:hypothetical protein